MATAAASFEDRDLSIGCIFNRAFGTIGRNPVATIGIAFLFGALPTALVGSGAQYVQTGSFKAIGFWPIAAISIATAVLMIVFSTLTQGALVRATIAHSEGREASLSESAAAGLAVVVPLFLLGLGSALGIGVGLILLVVPGAMLWVMWSVAAPALVEERIGVFEAFGRSNGLTEGARWKIFGLLLILLISTWIFGAIIAALNLALHGSLMRPALAASHGFSLSDLALNAVENTVSTVIWGVMQTSLYVELRNWKDGPPTDALVDVFG
ncbi:MAG TPA: hypothetical protein VH331_08210 [Allosphingosinicella sp.]|jgi:hypothetical protein|nr:hypothetical protein [Allosphingosinicella sp.]